MEQIIMDLDTKFNKASSQLEDFLLKDNYHLSLVLNLPSVKNVIQIALELTKKNRLITTELLYNISKKELKIPQYGLNKIIQMLLDKKFLVERSLFTKKTILKNETRSYIYKLINKYIGAHFSFLKRKVSQFKGYKMGAGQLTWHLDKLIKFDLIKKVKVKNYLIFLPIDISNEEGILYFILRDPLNRLIINSLLEIEYVNKAEIYKEFNVKRAKMYYRIKNLIELGVISPIIDDKKNISLNSDNRDLIKSVITNILYDNG